VSASIKALRQSGASRIFLAGHSQGAVFAIHYATKHPLDGLVLIAAGGSVATPFYRKQIGASVDRARQLVAEGKGKVPGEFEEFEGGKGHWNVRTTAETYLSWFDAGGAMNLMKSAAALPKNLPVLQVTPTGDYPALLRAKQELFDALPAHPLKRLHEPVSNHRNAPRDAAGISRAGSRKSPRADHQRNHAMPMRKWRPQDLDATIETFRRAVHELAAADYSPEELEAWAPQGCRPRRMGTAHGGQPRLDIRDQRQARRLHHHRRSGPYRPALRSPRLPAHGGGHCAARAVGRRCRHARGITTLRTEASRSARPFFEQSGFSVLGAERIERHGVLLERFVMERRQ
jgi:pimeloyl-ACP methyl ester carboxylesterase